ALRVLPKAADWLEKLSAHGMEHFESLGFPTTKNEDWHFTSVTPIAGRTFRPAMLSKLGVSSDESTAGMVARADLRRFSFDQPGWHTLVFVNGEFSADLSSFAGIGQNV